MIVHFNYNFLLFAVDALFGLWEFLTVDTNQHEYSEICTVYFYILAVLKMH